VFWRRLNTTGNRKNLGFFEKQFAFGIKVQKTKIHNEYMVSLKAMPNRPILLRQTAKGKAALFLTIGQHQTNPVYLYINLKQGALVPTVAGLKIHAIDIASGKAVTETFSVSGGKLQK
jgi:hypothetical protein